MDAEESAVEQSPEDKIADMIFGPDDAPPEKPQEQPEPESTDDLDDTEVEADEDDALDASESDDDEPEFVEIDIDGQLYEVPKALESHLMRDKDYTEKTQQASAQRKEAETLITQMQAERSKYEFLESVQDEFRQAEEIKARIDQAKQYRRDNIDSLDYKDILKIDQGVSDLNDELQGLGQTLQTKQGEFQQAQQQAIEELLVKSTEVLRAKIPGWGEDKQRQLRDFALGTGFTEQELNQVYDPRYVEVLFKASQYDKLQQGKGAAIKKVQDAPSIRTKARNPMPEATKRKLNMRKQLKSGGVSNQDKANLVGLDIAERFNM